MTLLLLLLLPTTKTAAPSHLATQFSSTLEAGEEFYQDADHHEVEEDGDEHYHPLLPVVYTVKPGVIRSV